VNDPEFEARVRGELHDAAELVEPQRTLEDLRRRIKIWRLFHRRPRRLHRAARSTEDPPTLLLPAATTMTWRAGLSTDVSFCQPVPRCVCSRPAEPRWPWCCWVCRAAVDGGWTLGPWRAGLHWTAAHTWACEQRRQRHAAVAWRRTPDDPARTYPPMPGQAVPPPGPDAPAHVRYPLETGPPTPPTGGQFGLLRPRAGLSRPPGSPAGSHRRRKPTPGIGPSLMGTCAEAGCPTVQPFATACHCHACHVTFGTLTLFDAHQDWTAGWASLSCRSPLTLGLVADHNGTWQTPEGLRARTQAGVRLNERWRSR
jgi:hypothetical protein